MKGVCEQCGVLNQRRIPNNGNKVTDICLTSECNASVEFVPDEEFGVKGECGSCGKFFEAEVPNSILQDSDQITADCPECGEPVDIV